MENKSLIQSIRDFFCTCPLLKDGAIHVDYLGVLPTEYSIDGVPAKKEVKAYIDGSALCQYVFTFGSVEKYGSDVETNIENSGFYENFVGWLKEKSQKKELPSLGCGREALNRGGERRLYD